MSQDRYAPSASAFSAALRPKIRPQERGVVLIWAMMTAMLVAGIIFTATSEMKAVDEVSGIEFSANGLAEEVAQAGLTEALSWFRRQEQQPVRTFVPKGLPPELRDPLTLPVAKRPPGLEGKAPPGLEDKAPPGRTGALPPGQAKRVAPVGGAPSPEDYYSTEVVDSETPELGLVRSYEISPGIWGRYTVGHGVAAETFEDVNGNALYDEGEPFEDANGDGKWTASRATRDVSKQRGQDGAGAVWYVTSVGEVFRRVEAGKRLGEGQNVRIGHSTWGFEVRRLTVAPPAAAALIVQQARELKLGLGSHLVGSTAVAYAAKSGTILDAEGVEGAVAGLEGLDTSVGALFGLGWSKLASLADLSTAKADVGLPSKLPTNGLVVVRGDARFSAERPLRGRAMLAVDGNVEIESGSDSYFEGLLYVDGDLTIRGAAALRGIVIVTGAVDLRGKGSETVRIEHDGPLVGSMMLKLAQYRSSKSPFRLRDKFEYGLPGEPAPGPLPTPDPGPGPGPSKSDKPEKDDPCSRSVPPAEPECTCKSGKCKSGKCKKVKVKSVKIKSVKLKSKKKSPDGEQEPEGGCDGHEDVPVEPPAKTKSCKVKSIKVKSVKGASKT